MVTSAPFLVAIDGFGAAGKTTLAAALSQQLQDCPIIHMDDFCYPRSGREGEWWGDSIQNYGFDIRRCRDQVLLPASRAQVIQHQRLDWEDFTLKSTPPIALTAPYLIIEGCCSLHKELRSFYHLKVWLDSANSSLPERVLARDGEHMLPHWNNEFLPAARAYERDHASRSCADLLLKVGDGPKSILRALQKVQRPPRL